jgi:hypothetical protein
MLTLITSGKTGTKDWELKRVILEGDWTPDVVQLPGPISDHDYVPSLLQQSIEELSGHPELPDDDGSDCVEATEEYWKRRFPLN